MIPRFSRASEHTGEHVVCLAGNEGRQHDEHVFGHDVRVLPRVRRRPPWPAGSPLSASPAARSASTGGRPCTSGGNRASSASEVANCPALRFEQGGLEQTLRVHRIDGEQRAVGVERLPGARPDPSPRAPGTTRPRFSYGAVARGARRMASRKWASAAGTSPAARRWRPPGCGDSRPGETVRGRRRPTRFAASEVAAFEGRRDPLRLAGRLRLVRTVSDSRRITRTAAHRHRVHGFGSRVGACSRSKVASAASAS